MFMVDEHPLPWLAPLLNGVEHANFFETRATEYSKAATRGNWNEVWDNFDRRQNAKAVAAANEDTQEGGLFDKSCVFTSMPVRISVMTGRSEERSVGEEWVGTCRSRWHTYH